MIIAYESRMILMFLIYEQFKGVAHGLIVFCF